MLLFGYYDQTSLGSKQTHYIAAYTALPSRSNFKKKGTITLSIFFRWLTVTLRIPIPMMIFLKRMRKKNKFQDLLPQWLRDLQSTLNNLQGILFCKRICQPNITSLMAMWSLEILKKRHNIHLLSTEAILMWLAETYQSQISNIMYDDFQR